MKKQHIQIVEKNVIAGLDIKRQLECLGYTVKQDTAELKINIKDPLPDLIISNIAILNQGDFIKFKQLLIETQLPVICIGVELDDSAMQKCEGVNIVGKFTIPFDSVEIINLINDNFYKRENVLQE